MGTCNYFRSGNMLLGKVVPLKMIRYAFEKITLMAMAASVTYFFFHGRKLEPLDPLRVMQSSTKNPFVVEVSDDDVAWCHKKLRFLNPPGPVTALASYPGSGNTWMRYLLQQATGIVTGSVYNATHLKKSCFPGEGIWNGSVLAVKTHVGRKNPNPKWPSHYDRVIVLVRDPFHAVLAEFNRQHSHNHTGFASAEMFEDKWQSFAAEGMENWKGFHLYFDLNYSSHQILYTRYESLRDNLKHELQRVLHFLGYSMTAEMAECVHQNREGLFHRPEPKIDQSVYFDPDQVLVMKKIRNEMFKRLGLIP